MTTKNSRISGISKPSHFFGSNINPSEKLNKKIAAFAEPKSRLAYRTASSALNKTTIVADQSLIPAADGNDVNLEKQIKKRNLPLKNGIQTSSNVMNKTQQNGIKSIKSVASLRSQLKDNSVVPSSKIGLKIQANIGDIQSPPKSQLKRNAANYNTSHAHNKDDRVKLVSYAQRRTQYKIQTENTLSSSIDQLFTSSKLIANRSTADFKLDRSKLHEEDKADTMPDDKRREEMLFGDVLNDDQPPSPKIKSRNQVIPRHTYTYNKEENDIIDIPDDESIPEENYDLNINEHDEEILLKSVNVNHLNSQGLLNPNFYLNQNKSFAIPQLDLEVIKEAEDTIISPK